MYNKEKHIILKILFLLPTIYMACLDIIFVVEFSTRLLTTSTLLKKRNRSTVSLGYALKMWTRNPMCYVSSDIGGKSHT